MSLPVDQSGNRPDDPPRAPSFRHNLAARFLADVFGMVASLGAATITARALGPSGRGFYASLTLLAVLFAQLANLGLGEAAVVLPGKGKASPALAVSATLGLTVPLGIAGALACVTTAIVTLDAVGANEKAALGLAGCLVLLTSCSNTLAWLLASRERLVPLAVITTSSAALMTLSLYVLVTVLDTGVAGAVLASVGAMAFTILPLVRMLRREGVSLKPSWDVQYLRSAARFGIPVQVSNVLVQMAARLDLLFVYRLAGSGAAGNYSISLTLGALVASVPMALAYASFPRLPRLSDEESRELISSLFRVGIVAAAMTAVGLGLAAPLAIPLFFGTAYQDAVVPTLILLPAGVLWSGQWILSRAAASRGLARPLFVSFLLSFIVMVTLDIVLIDPLGTRGASLASLVSSTVGFAIALRYSRSLGWPWRHLVPRPADVRLLFTTTRQLLSSALASGRSTAR